MTRLSALIVLAILSGCGGAKHPLNTDDGGAGSTGSAGAGGTGTATGGTTGTGGGFGTGSGGTTGGSGGTTGTGGTSGGTGGSRGGGGFGGILDGGLGGILDSGVISNGCPANANGQMCGGPGNPLACFNPSDGGVSGCLCIAQRWACGTPGGAGDAGQGMGMGSTPCPANANGMTCPMAGALCGSFGAGCLCLPGQGGGAATWRCQ